MALLLSDLAHRPGVLDGRHVQEVAPGALPGLLDEAVLRLLAHGVHALEQPAYGPGVVGEQAEIIRLQMQEFEKYTAYPIWVKMLSGVRTGKIYGL